MTDSPSAPGKFWAYVAVAVGAILILLGTATAIGYFGLPLLAFGEDILAAQLGQMAGIFLGWVCGPLAVAHGIASIRGRASRRLRMAPIHIFAILFAITLGLGSLLLNFEITENYLFPPLFTLGAALPTVAVLAWAFRRLGWPITWRQAGLALVGGATLSIFLAILLEAVLPFLASILIEPLGMLAESFGDALSSGGFLDRLFFSPAALVFLLFVAVQAPLPEEFAKALGLPIFGRRRITRPEQAFAVGMACGAGFGILENMLYEGLYAQSAGWSWAGIALLRAIGSVLHPLCTGLVALGWFRAREAGGAALLKSYLLAVGVHTLWNGGFLPFVYLTGLDALTEYEVLVSFYGLAEGALLVAFLVVLSAALWWYLGRLTTSLGTAGEAAPEPAPITPRALAAWAVACLLVIVPIGAALGPAWQQFQGEDRIVAISSTPDKAIMDATSTTTAPPTATRTPLPTATPTITRTSLPSVTPTVSRTPLPSRTPTPTTTLASSGNLALNRTVRASSSRQYAEERAVDGKETTSWGAGAYAPQWIEIDLGAPATISGFRLRVGQSPSGRTKHRILVGREGALLTEIHEFDQATEDAAWLTFSPAAPLEDVQIVRIETLESPSWVAWYEIQVIGTR